MLYVQVKRAPITGEVRKAKAFEFDKITDKQRRDPTFENRNDWKTFEVAKEIAAALGSEYIATDAGPYVSPRYDIIKLPKVGDEVSYAFNGDSYPCGAIKSISPTLKKIVAGPDFSGKDRAFYRRGETGSWKHSGTWSLIGGHVSKTNPEF